MLRIVNTPHITAAGTRVSNVLEAAIEDDLLARDYDRIVSSKQKDDGEIFKLLMTEPKLFKRSLSHGSSIAGKPRKVDFAISTQGLPILIEAKSQEVRGSAYQKIPFAIQDLQQTGLPWLFVYDGDEVPPGIIEHQLDFVGNDINCKGLIEYRHFPLFLDTLERDMISA